MKKKNTSNKPDFKTFMNSRSVQHGLFSILISAMVIAAIVLLNVVVGSIASNTNLTVDVTANSSFRLQSTTEDYISAIDKPVDIYVLQKEVDFESGDSNNYKYYVQANKLLHAMADSSDNITLHYEDITVNPTFTADYPEVDWTKSHMLLVTSGDLYRTVDLTEMFNFNEDQLYSGYYVIESQNVEQAVMNTLINVIIEDKIKVMVLTGQEENDMSAFSTLLENNAYEVESVSLLNNDIPKDAEFIVIYAPKVDISEDICKKLSDWLKNNGNYGHNIIFFPSDQTDVKEFVNLNSLLEEYGMAVRDGYIYENDSNNLIPGYNHYLSIFNYPENDTTYTEKLRNPSIPVVMDLTMPVSITDSNKASALLLSSENSFFFPRNPDDNYTPETEKLNGAAIGTLGDGTDNAKTSSIAVIGSYDAVTSDFLSISSYNNASYFVNLFNTLASREDVSIVIEGKNPSSGTLGAISESDIAFPSILVRFVIPIGILLLGLILWIVRRFKHG